MSQNEIFLPMVALAFWTFVILTLVPMRRVHAVNKGKVSIKEFKHGESAKVPGDVSIPNRNYMNLLELPLLFYVVCLMFFVTNTVSQLTLEIAWAYVGFRLAQTLIHITYNNVIHRLTMFAVSNFILVSLWLLFFFPMMK